MIEAPTPTRIWQGIEAADPPIAREDSDQLLKMAEAMLKSRRDRFPGEVAGGKLTADEAQRELTAFEYLVANWRFIATGQGEPAGRGADHVLRDSLDEAIARIAAFAGEAGGFTETLGTQAQAVFALRWHLEPGRETIALARLNHQLRADARAANSSKEPAQ
jgi:hypothetical protein